MNGKWNPFNEIKKELKKIVHFCVSALPNGQNNLGSRLFQCSKSKFSWRSRSSVLEKLNLLSDHKNYVITGFLLNFNFQYLVHIPYLGS